jgi:hypothetical protein
VRLSLSHENILPLFDSHLTPEATYLITLYSLAGSLLDIQKTEGTPGGTDRRGVHVSPGRHRAAVLHEIMELIHGDATLENVLVDSPILASHSALAAT